VQAGDGVGAGGDVDDDSLLMVSDDLW